MLRGVDRDALLRHSLQPGGREPAPPALELVQAFVNTVDREHGPDLFDALAGLREWLGVRGIAVRVGATELVRARAVREGIRSLLLVNNSHDPEPGALAALDRALAGADLAIRFPDARAQLQPARSGFDGVLARLAADIVNAAAGGSWSRLKACPGHNCQWAFYDRSKNRTASWCSMQICGGRAKAAAYYRRHRRPDG
jgi:predicted RNA-binding Zn ribbon-like protein